MRHATMEDSGDQNVSGKNKKPEFRDRINVDDQMFKIKKLKWTTSGRNADGSQEWYSVNEFAQMKINQFSRVLDSRITMSIKFDGMDWENYPCYSVVGAKKTAWGLWIERVENVLIKVE